MHEVLHEFVFRVCVEMHVDASEVGGREQGDVLFWVWDLALILLSIDVDRY